MTNDRSQLGLLASTMTPQEAVVLLADRLDELAAELDLAAQHKNNPGSTNGTLVQTANSLRAMTAAMREALRSAL